MLAQSEFIRKLNKTAFSSGFLRSFGTSDLGNPLDGAGSLNCPINSATNKMLFVFIFVILYSLSVWQKKLENCEDIVWKYVNPRD